MWQKKGKTRPVPTKNFGLVSGTNKYLRVQQMRPRAHFRFLNTFKHFINPYKHLLEKKSKLIRFLDSWRRNPVFQFLLGKFVQVGRILGPLEPLDEIDRVSTSDDSTPSGAN